MNREEVRKNIRRKLFEQTISLSRQEITAIQQDLNRLPQPGNYRGLTWTETTENGKPFLRFVARIVDVDMGSGRTYLRNYTKTVEEYIAQYIENATGDYQKARKDAGWVVFTKETRFEEPGSQYVPTLSGIIYEIGINLDRLNEALVPEGM